MKDKILAAYYSDGGYGKMHFSEADIKKLTHVNWAFAVVKDGRVTGEHLKHVDHLHHYKAVNPNLKTLISIGGWGAGGFSEAASTQAGRELFADTAVEVMQQFDFDGIDIDWEYPGIAAAGIGASVHDKENFTLMLKDVRERLNQLEAAQGRKYLLTIAVGAYQKCIDYMEVKHIADNYLDFINIMTYDMGTGTTFAHHHTNLGQPSAHPQLGSVKKAVGEYIQAGARPEQLVIGGAFYARIWSGVSPENHGLYQEAATDGAKTADYSTLLAEYMGKDGYQELWDEEAQAPYLYNGDSFVSYDNERSLTEKVKYVQENGLLGIMFWEYPLDDSRTLLNAVYQAFQNNPGGR